MNSGNLWQPQMVINSKELPLKIKNVGRKPSDNSSL
jgi:hypothetical protein